MCLAMRSSRLGRLADVTAAYATDAKPALGADGVAAGQRIGEHGPGDLVDRGEAPLSRVGEDRRERLLGVEVPIRAQYIRVMFDEITRLLNHLLWLGAHGLDCGAMNILIYCFREREDVFDMYEAVSGARMHAAYYRPGGVYRDLPDRMPQYEASTWTSAQKAGELNENRSGSLLDFLEDFTNRFPVYHSEYHTLLTDNRIWKQRLVNVGVVTPERALRPKT